MNTLFETPFVPAFTQLGAFAPSATLTFYLTGTTTKSAIYDDDGDALPNPVTADAFGRFPFIYLDPTVTYRVILKDHLGALIPGCDIDPFQGGFGGPTGASSIGYQQAGSGAYGTNVLARLRQTVHAEDFGIFPDGGVTNQFAKVQALLAAVAAGTVGSKILWPLGDVLITSSLSFAGRYLQIEGCNGVSRLIFGNNATLAINGGLLDENAGPSYKITDMTFCTKGGIHTSGPLSFTFGSNAIGSTWNPLIVQDCNFEGLTFTDGFITALSVHNCPNARITNVRFFGDAHNSLTVGVGSGTGLKMTADVGNAGSAYIDSLFAYWMDEACHIEGHFEGVTYTRGIAIFARHGLTILDDGATINILLQMSNCFWNCQVYCVRTRNMQDIWIDKTNSFYGQKMTVDATPASWQGVILDIIAPSTPINMTYDIDGEFAGNTSPATIRVGTAVNGLAASGTPGRVQGFYEGCTSAITLNAASKGVAVYGVRVLGTSNTTNVTDAAAGGNNNVGTFAATGPNFVLTGV